MNLPCADPVAARKSTLADDGVKETTLRYVRTGDGGRRPGEAIEIFRLNTEMFPRSGNAFDSLGEAYMIKGDRERAIENYKRSLELDPRNANAVVMLKKLGGS